MGQFTGYGSGLCSLDQFRIAAIRIDYISETVLGDNVLIQGQDVDPDGKQIILGVRQNPEQPVFQRE